MEEAVSELFYGLPIHGYCALSMNNIADLNDAVGGVTVTVPEELAAASGMNGLGRRLLITVPINSYGFEHSYR